jgi:hypothetical protein
LLPFFIEQQTICLQCGLKFEVLNRGAWMMTMPSFKGSALFLVSTSFAAVCFSPPALSKPYFVDLKNKQLTALPPLERSDVFDDPVGINDRGQVAGTTLVSGMERAFITGPNGQGVTLLGTLGGGTRCSS